MRQNKFVLCVLIIALVCSCSGCGLFGDQKYTCEVDDVKSIQIIRLDKYVEGEYRYEYTVLSEVTDVSVFVGRLNSLKHTVNWSDPRQLKTGYVVIRIDYLNGDYDLLHHSAQWKHRSGVNNNGYFFFNEEQFDKLVSDYV